MNDKRIKNVLYLQHHDASSNDPDIYSRDADTGVTPDDTDADAPRDTASDVTSDDTHTVAGEPPLHTAIRKKNVDVAHQLIEQGTDLELEDESGDTALAVAAV